MGSLGCPASAIALCRGVEDGEGIRKTDRASRAAAVDGDSRKWFVVECTQGGETLKDFFVLGLPVDGSAGM